MQDKLKYISELNFCLKLREEEGGCTFGGGTKCFQCAVPYLLHKLISGEVLHGDINRLSLQDRKSLIHKYNIADLSS